MKGSSVPSLVAIFSATVVFGVFVTGVVSSQTASIFDGANQKTTSEWAEERLAPIILDMCKQSGVQSPQPPGNLTQFFSSLESITTNKEVYQAQDPDNPYASVNFYLTEIKLDYGSNQNSVFIEDKMGGFSCDKIYYNGTDPDGSKVSWTDEFDVDESNLKFRVFETGSNGNITVQVRQD